MKVLIINMLCFLQASLSYTYEPVLQGFEFWRRNVWTGLYSFVGKRPLQVNSLCEDSGCQQLLGEVAWAAVEIEFAGI